MGGGRSGRLLALIMGALVVLTGCRPAQKVTPTPTTSTPTATTASAPGQPPALLCGGDSGRACHLSLFATEPDDGVAPLTARLAQATTSIDFVPFLLDEPGIVKALLDARKRGVQVRVLTEPEHEKENAKALKTLGAAGVETREASPAFSMTHAKYLILDQSRALMLTFNSTAKELPTRRDFALEDDDPNDVRFVQALFEADWQRQPLGAIPPGFALSPDNADETLPGLVRSAGRSLDLYAEKLESSPLLDAILEAARRGVEVRILAAPPSGKVPGPLQSLIRKGQVQVRVPRDLGVHAKVMLVDGRTVYLGSENVEDAVGDRRRELGLIFEEAPIAARLREVFERDWASPADPLG